MSRRSSPPLFTLSHFPFCFLFKGNELEEEGQYEVVDGHSLLICCLRCLPEHLHSKSNKHFSYIIILALRLKVLLPNLNGWLTSSFTVIFIHHDVPEHLAEASSEHKCSEHRSEHRSEFWLRSYSNLLSLLPCLGQRALGNELPGLMGSMFRMHSGKATFWETMAFRLLLLVQPNCQEEREEQSPWWIDSSEILWLHLGLGFKGKGSRKGSRKRYMGSNEDLRRGELEHLCDW